MEASLEVPVGNMDKIKDKAQEVTGEVKERLGEAMDDEDLADEGRADQAEGRVKQAGEHLADSANKAKEAVKDVFDK
jgi:uncharacterized protein YjbJ (UPF0337 family)